MCVCVCDWRLRAGRLEIHKHRQDLRDAQHSASWFSTINHVNELLPLLCLMSLPSLTLQLGGLCGGEHYGTLVPLLLAGQCHTGPTILSMLPPGAPGISHIASLLCGACQGLVPNYGSSAQERCGLDVTISTWKRSWNCSRNYLSIAAGDSPPLKW